MRQEVQQHLVDFAWRLDRHHVALLGQHHTARAWDARHAANPGVFDELQALCPLPRLSTPADIAESVAFLVSDRAAMITGTVLTVDGGLSAGVPSVGRTVTQQPKTR